MAEKIIIEVNTAAPSFEGLHDITMTDLPPRRKPYLIMAPEDRIGTPHIPVDPERVVAIVESDYPDQTTANTPEDDTSRAIASNLIEFLQHEVDHGRLPINLLPIQSGIGNIANAVIGGLSVGLRSKFVLQYDSQDTGRPSKLQESEGLDRGTSRHLPRPIRQRQARLRDIDFHQVLSRGIQAILRWLGKLPLKAPPAITASLKFTRDYSTSRCDWHEHSCRGRYLCAR